MNQPTKLIIDTDSAGEAALLIEILAEIARAKAKHPLWPDDHVSRAAIIAEEAGEVIREANHLREGHGNVKNLRLELIQTAATCIRMANLMDTENEIVHETTARRGKGLSALLPDTNKIYFSNSRKHA